MIIDYRTLEALAFEFIRRRGENYITGSFLPGDDTTNLGSETHKFNNLYVANLYADVLQAANTSMDMVDGFHASATPQPNMLLALNNEGKFPAEVLEDLLSLEGGTLTGNLNAAPGVLIDGVDINLFKSDYDLHKTLPVSDAHGGVGPHNHRTDADGGDLTQYASADGQGSRLAYMAERLRKHVLVGDGLLGGGLLDQDIILRVNAGGGLSIGTSGALQLDTPGSISASSTNSASGNHTHAVSASDDPSDSQLLKSTNLGGLRLRRFAVGTAAVPGAGNIAASGDIRGNRIISDLDAFVENNLNVGTSVLNTSKSAAVVFINRESENPGLTGALTVRPGRASQRGVVIQGKTGQESIAPLLSAANASGQDVFRVLADGTIESGSPEFVSGLQGWRVTGEGDAEFRNIVARGELHTSVFVANEMHATGGTMAVMPTGIVDSPIQATDNLVGATFNLIIAGDPNLPGACAFDLNDVLRVKLITGLQEN